MHVPSGTLAVLVQLYTSLELGCLVSLRLLITIAGAVVEEIYSLVLHRSKEPPELGSQLRDVVRCQGVDELQYSEDIAMTLAILLQLGTRHRAHISKVHSQSQRIVQVDMLEDPAVLSLLQAEQICSLLISSIEVEVTFGQ